MDFLFVYFSYKYSKKNIENRICKLIIEILYLGKIKNIDMNPINIQARKIA